MVSSLILEAIVGISKYPLHHQQGNLLPVGECVPGNTGVNNKPSNIYRLKGEPLKLNWLRTVKSCYSDLKAGDMKEQMKESFLSVISKIQADIDKAIDSQQAKCCMLTHIGPRFRQGWGDLGKESGGYATFVDHRTGNIYELSGKTVNDKVYLEVNINYCLVRIVPDKK
jgi:hypothetical protein